MQQENSVMAIGSGQLTGKGLNNNEVSSANNGNYVPEIQTDFIFAVAGEELGFVGCFAIVLLLFLIIFECLRTGRRAKDREECSSAAGWRRWWRYRVLLISV